MTGLMTRTRNWWGESASPVESPYSIRCICGEPIQGVRQPHYQIVTCPSCGEPQFVLPMSPLPAPRAPTVSTRSRRPLSDAPASVPSVPIGQRVAGLGARTARTLSHLVPPRRWFTRSRMIAAGIILFVSSTVWYQLRQAHFRDLRTRVIPEARRGLQALGEGEFAEARLSLDAVVEWMDQLREPIEDEGRFRQAQREVAVLSELLPQSLDRELDGASGSIDATNRSLSGRAIILDTIVEPSERGSWSVTYTPFLDGQPLRIDVSQLELLSLLNIRRPKRLIFGARLAAIVNDDQGNRSLTVDPTSGVLLTEPRIFAELGLDRDESAIALRREQKAMIDDVFGSREAGDRP